ncbi:hypothetical protein Scep_028772 [Stephania cephalantha]|uniref:Uncharacterized protein n=1 Tax=Stephania cephalantha TaxID=152367 RepID=A0AAP0ECM6_9MAGN
MGNCCTNRREWLWEDEDEGEGEDKECYAKSGATREPSSEKEEENRVDLKNSRLEQQQQQVKIKISKKQLEGLVSRGDHDRFRGLSMEQVLLQLIKINDQCNYIANDEQQGQEEQIKSWRPSLQSIPELN